MKIRITGGGFIAARQEGADGQAIKLLGSGGGWQTYSWADDLEAFHYELSDLSFDWQVFALQAFYMVLWMVVLNIIGWLIWMFAIWPGRPRRFVATFKDGRTLMGMAKPKVLKAIAALAPAAAG